MNVPHLHPSTGNGKTQKQPRDHARGRRRSYNPTSHRLRELERIIVARHGKALDTDDADFYLVRVAQCLKRFHQFKNGAATYNDVLDRLKIWAQFSTPLVDDDALRGAVDEVMDKANLESADVIARRLRVTNAEREALKLRSIGACDLSRAARVKLAKERRKRRDRQRIAAKRRALGVKPRQQYLAESRAQAKPWLAEGISRRTWYRHQAGGMSQRQAAKVLGVTEKTVRNDVRINSAKIAENVRTGSAATKAQPNGTGPSPHGYLTYEATHLCHRRDVPRPLTPSKREVALLRGVVPWSCAARFNLSSSIACSATTVSRVGDTGCAAIGVKRTTKN